MRSIPIISLCVSCLPVVNQGNYAGENPAGYDAEFSLLTPKLRAVHTCDNRNNHYQGPLEPPPFAKDYVAAPSKDTIGQRAL
jgi:sugar phosphate isomerase/epimerase